MTFESTKYAGFYLSVDQSGTVSVRKLPPDSGEVQFAVRVQVHTFVCVLASHVHQAKLMCRYVCQAHCHMDM